MSYNNSRYNSGHKNGFHDYRYKNQKSYYQSSYSGKGYSRGADYKKGRFYDSNTFSSSTASSSSQNGSLSSSKLINTNSSSDFNSVGTNKANDVKSKTGQSGIHIIKGTDPASGVNENDSKFEELQHNTNFSSQIKFYKVVDPKKNYKVLYDPELDKTLSKEERKTKQKKIRFNGESVSEGDITDPRKTKLSSYFLKPNKRSKKFPYKQLPQPKFIFDKDSLGPPPQTEVVMWDLQSTTSELYLTNFIKSYGDGIKAFQFINDPVYGVPLGIATFKFQGNPDKAMKLAKDFIKRVKEEEPIIDGAQLKAGLNDSENKLLQTKIEISKSKIRVSKYKREEEEKKRIKQIELETQRKRDEAKKAELKKKEDLKRKDLKPNEDTSQESHNTNKAIKSSVIKSGLNSNSTILSIRSHNKVVPGVFLPKDVKWYVKDRPYIIIRDKYVSTKNIPSQDIKRALKKYDWARILPDRTGFFIIFNSLRECERCFMNEDGRKFYEYRMYMELALPEGYSERGLISDDEDGSSSARMGIDDIEEATNILIKEFQKFLAKDIRERIIAPVVLDLLSHDKYPKLVEEMKLKEARKPIQTITNTSNYLKQNALNILALKKKQTNPLPSFKKKPDILKRDSIGGRNSKIHVIPMQHALNFDDSEESEEESSRSITPVASTLKRERSTTSTSTMNEDDIIDSPPAKKQKSDLRKSILYESSSDEETQIAEEAEASEIASESEKEVLEELDYANVEEKYQPCEDYPRPVYEDVHVLPSDPFDLDRLQDLIKDDEDLKLATKAFSGINVKPALANIDINYWAWKQKDMKSDASEIAEDVDLIEDLDPQLESRTGAFKSDGYKKFTDADKIQYLPHRRKIHKPIKTIQHDDDDNNAGGTVQNNIQSSRVNRANNRRFAADISAQLGTETEAMSLNALTKRKKPVSYARSAIHNWGLYALEPISAKEMIIEYVGEMIRQQVAEHREKSYLKTGIGSSYLFRVDENTVIDATKKGGIARFINHCCDPSCTAKIIKVEGQKRIVIYALRDIEANEELTYDYKFERETNDAERIKCLCGAPSCKGYLN